VFNAFFLAVTQVGPDAHPTLDEKNAASLTPTIRHQLVSLPVNIFGDTTSICPLLHIKLNKKRQKV